MNPNIYGILQTIAQRHGVASNEVYAEIQSAIDKAYADPNPDSRRAWLRYGFRRRPTVEELLIGLTNAIPARP